MMASGVGWRAMAALSGATLCTCERLSRDGSAWLPRRGVHALHTVFLFRLSPKVGKNQRFLTINIFGHRVGAIAMQDAEIELVLVREMLHTGDKGVLE